MVHDGIANFLEDLVNDEEGGDNGDVVSGSGEPEQRKVMTQTLLFLLGACFTFPDTIQGTETDSNEREQMIAQLTLISGRYQKQYNNFKGRLWLSG